jgi:hypothetical protein
MAATAIHRLTLDQSLGILTVTLNSKRSRAALPIKTEPVNKSLTQLHAMFASCHAVAFI